WIPCATVFDEGGGPAGAWRLRSSPGSRRGITGSRRSRSSAGKSPAAASARRGRAVEDWSMAELGPGRTYRLPDGVGVLLHDSPANGWTFRSVRNRFEFYQVKGDGSLVQYVLRVGKRTSTFEPILDRPTGYTVDDPAPPVPPDSAWRRALRTARRLLCGMAGPGRP